MNTNDRHHTLYNIEVLMSIIYTTTRHDDGIPILRNTIRSSFRFSIEYDV